MIEITYQDIFGYEHIRIYRDVQEAEVAIPVEMGKFRIVKDAVRIVAMDGDTAVEEPINVNIEYKVSLTKK